MEKGPDDYLVKPFAARELLARVRAHLSLSSRRKEASAALEKMVHDRTSQLQLEKAKLQRSNRELEQFAAAAAHDLRVPVKAMRNWVDVMEESVARPRSPEVVEAMSFLRFNAIRAEKFINDLLALARIDFKDIPRETFDLGAVLKNSKEVLRQEIAAAGAEVTVGPMPTLWGHQIYVELVFNNLLRNAILYRPVGRPPRVKVACRDDGDFHLFSVEDNGIGIEKQYWTSIFDMFKRLHGEFEYPGSGIGLASCKKVIDLSGGRIWVESTPGVGSTFFFTYPKDMGGR
jgi:light-regulated signal transduction histidine kinase (bacteriophytochrome)